MVSGFLVMLVTIAPAPADLQQFVGREVTLTGTWDWRGKQGAYVSLTAANVYVIGSVKSCPPDLDNGKTVRVTGVLRLREAQPPLDVKPQGPIPFGRLPAHLYFDGESARIEVVER